MIIDISMMIAYFFIVKVIGKVRKRRTKKLLLLKYQGFSELLRITYLMRMLIYKYIERYKIT